MLLHQIQPKTEQEYWLALRDVGARAWSVNEDLTWGSFLLSPGIYVHGEDAAKLRQEFATEVSEKFGVILPQDYPQRDDMFDPLPAAPEGKVYYAHWFTKQENAWYKERYSQCLCSACPFSNGLDAFRTWNHHPCSGITYSGETHYPLGSCVLVDTFHRISRQQLHTDIRARSGVRGLQAFLAKEASFIQAAS